jgi:medium-chain acyl-[acyl-carrier-protein] hydrolase
MFRTWADVFPAAIEVCAAQLPGRENRLGEPHFTRLQTLVEAVADALAPMLDTPFAFFGHSMGAMIGFELTRSLRRQHRLEPVHLFISGRRAPQIPHTERPTYNLPEAELLDELRRLSGTPTAVLENPELLQLVLPLLRTDFEVCQTYTYVPEAALGCPITVFGGLQDAEVPRESLAAWREQTSASFTLRMFPGDHFFLHTMQHDITRTISGQLSRLLSA